MEVPTIYKAYDSGDIPPKHGPKYGTNVPPFQDPGIPIDAGLENHSASISTMNHESQHAHLTWRRRVELCPRGIRVRERFQ